MEISSFFLSLLLILLFARILGELAAWLSIPSVMGEMLAGILLGPSLLGWVEPTHIVQTLAEIGLILLLFEVGLDTDLGQMAKAGSKASVVAIGGFIALASSVLSGGSDSLVMVWPMVSLSMVILYSFWA